MGRLLFLLGLIALTAYLLKKLILEQKLEKKPEKELEPQLMRKCTLCKVHVPDHIAIQHDEHFFCSDAHRNEFLKP